MTVPPPWLTPLLSQPQRVSASIALGAAFLAAPEAERAAVLSGWDFGVSWPYPAPERLACTRGEPGTPRERITAALILNAIESREDARDQLIFLCVAHHSCLLAGLDPRALFARVAAALPRTQALALEEFARRKPADQALAAFGLHTQLDAHGETEIHSD